MSQLSYSLSPAAPSAAQHGLEKQPQRGNPTTSGRNRFWQIWGKHNNDFQKVQANLSLVLVCGSAPSHEMPAALPHGAGTDVQPLSALPRPYLATRRAREVSRNPRTRTLCHRHCPRSWALTRRCHRQPRSGGIPGKSAPGKAPDRAGQCGTAPRPRGSCCLRGKRQEGTPQRGPAVGAGHLPRRPAPTRV